jgi:hypothetical protein
MARQDSLYTPPQPKKGKKEPPPFKLDFKYLLYKLFFPSLKNRGKREYVGILVRRSSTYLAIAYAITIVLSIVMYYLTDLSLFYGLIWSPEEILYIPFLSTFISQNLDSLITNYIVTIFLPFFISGIICAIIWGEEARDLVLSSAVVTFLLFITLHLSQVILFSNLAASISGVFAGFWYFGYIFIFSLSFLIICALGGIVGVRFGKLFINMFLPKKGAKITYSNLIQPKMPLSVQTIFDLDKPPKSEDRQFHALSMVYMNRKVERLLKTTDKESCKYFADGKCAYLGYVTSEHKYQICLTDYWPLCRIYAFLSESKVIIEETLEGEKNG